MTKKYTHKLQGDGRDSWLCEEMDGLKVVNKYMVYENPFAEKKDKVDDFTDEEIEKLKIRLGITNQK